MARNIFKWISRWKKFFILIIVLLTILYFLQDYLVPFYYEPNYERRHVKELIIDVNGYIGDINQFTSNDTLYIRWLGVNDFRSLGSVDADIIVIIAHGLAMEDENKGGIAGLGGYALETSEPSTLFNALKHPLLILSGSIVRGKVSGLGERIALTKNIFMFSKSFDGKTIVLITCGTNQTYFFAEEFILHGAERVFYTNTTTSMDKVKRILNVITTIEDLDSLKHALLNESLYIIEKGDYMENP